MNPAVVSAAILARLQADSTLYTGGAWTAAIAGGVSWLRSGPSAPSFPYVVFDLEGEASNAFTGAMGNATLTFTMFDDDANGASRLSVLYDRIFGDAMSSSGSRVAPTFGFHHHKLSLPETGATNVLGWTASEMDYKRSSLSYASETVLQQVMVFGFNVSNSAVNV